MGKPGLKSTLNENEAFAVSRMLRISPQKLNLVATQMRGKNAADAINILKFSKKRIARDVIKTLSSAIANADMNMNLDIDRLIVAEAFVGKNIVMKRHRARARGRAAQILKPFSQITIVVREVMEET